MKAHHKDQPLGLFGRVVIEFAMNDDLAHRDRCLRDLIKSLERDCKASASLVRDTILDDPERGSLVVALCAAKAVEARNKKEKILALVDSESGGRLVLEEWEEVSLVLP